MLFRRQRPNPFRFALLLTLLALLAFVYLVQRRIWLERDFSQAVLEHQTARVHELLESGTDPEIRIGTSIRPLPARTWNQWLRWLLRQERPGTRDPRKTALMAAADFGDADMARDLLAHGAEVNARTMNGTTALLLAANRHDPALVQMLLDHGADPLARNQDGMTPLLLAAMHGNLPIIRILLAHGAPLRDATPTGITLLQLAAGMPPRRDGVQNGYPEPRPPHMDVVMFLINQGANSWELSTVGMEPLLLAARYGTPAAIERCWRLPSNSPRPYALLGRALGEAARAGRLDAARCLIALGAPVRQLPPPDGCIPPPLVQAAAGRNPAVVSLLLDHGADVNGPASSGVTPLVAALQAAGSSPPGGSPRDPLATAKLLIARGAYVRAPDRSEIPADVAAARKADLPGGARYFMLLTTAPIVSAARAGPEATELLLQHGADPNARDAGWITALMAATRPETARLLLDHGADVNVQDVLGRTPLRQAVEMGNQQLVELLIAHGADPNLPDRQGTTPLTLAAQRGSTRIEDCMAAAARSASRRRD